MQTTSPIDPIFAPIVKSFTQDVAARILEIELDPTTQQRADEWAARASQGLLSPAEKLEYEAMTDKIDVLGIVQSLARQALLKCESSSQSC